MEKAIEVRDVKKYFYSKKRALFKKSEVKEFKAVDGVSFDIYKGEIFGLLGPNGAGKTTLIKMITGLLLPTEGTILVLGIDVVKETIKAQRNIGTVLAGDRSIYWKLTARENLEYFGALYGLKRKEAKERAEMILERLGISEKADQIVEKFSTGMKQKVALGKALMPNAPILLLDEPTLGLDPQSAINLREIILEFKREGKTILLTTHYMEEADFLSDRVAIIDSGKIIALDKPDNLKKSINEVKTMKLELMGASYEIIEGLKNLEKVQNVLSHYNQQNRTFEVTIHHYDGESVIHEILDYVLKKKAKVLNINVEEPSLEDVFIHLTGKSLRE
ncbi:ABC transporter ATP-binding protein [Caloramator australicus]|uniref:ABC transporter, ATP-binding protein n=1 Tax=Caloramator australicus RC3 TaxID=857293 RepID=G0V3H4_9CLOT|nr:ATP-binding cassette domain-containing protein [Caloramator australicus]CCC57664.1 ABC transporter, ATP-binding protein [Caloramator australicus RC3]